MNHTKFYAFVSFGLIGIFTSWEPVNQLRQKNYAQYRSFFNYYEAQDFVRAYLTNEDMADFGILGRNMQFDRPYIRTPQNWVQQVCSGAFPMYHPVLTIPATICKS